MFIVTGGVNSKKTVAEFTKTGQVTYLADLQVGRYWHACSKFEDDTGETVSFNELKTWSSNLLNTIILGFTCYWGKGI